MRPRPARPLHAWQLTEEQRARLRLTLLALGGAALLSVMVVLMQHRGQMRLDAIGLGNLLGAYWLGNLTFPLLILSGLNQRLRDPSMTLAQVLWATVSAFTILFFVDEGRHLVLMMYLLAMMLGAFRLDVSEYLVVTLSAVVLYALVIAALARLDPRGVQIEQEFLNWLIFLVVMVGFSLLGSETSRLRAALERRNRELHDAWDATAAAYRAKSRFLVSRSDELGKPIDTLVRAGAELERSALDEAGHAAVESVRLASGHLLTLINGMADLAALESDDLELAPGPVDLRRELETVRDTLQPLAAERGLALILEVDPALAHPVEGDAMRLREVLVHLIGNALRFTAHGEIRLSAARDGADRVRFEVADTGAGIARDRVPGLLRPSSDTDSGHASSGLGLTLCSQLIARMQGALELTSTLGEGSRFGFSIPMPRVAPCAAAAPAPSTMRVLIVDDSEDSRLLLRTFLKGFVGRVDEAEDGHVGVRRFQEQRHDVVLMDMHMPGMDGLAATRAIRELERADGATPCVILALTADDSAEDRSRSLEAGCDDHLVKPVSKKALRAALAARA